MRGKTKVFTLPDGTVIDRTREFAKPDPVVEVMLPDGYGVRFWVQRLKNVQYAALARQIQEEERPSND